MKNLALTLFVYLFLIAPSDIYAGNSTLIANYPAPKVSYNNVTLNTQSTTNIDCSIASNAGLLFMDPTLNTLERCANGQTVPVPYPENCFNRFCSCSGPSCSALCTATNNFSTGSVCPAGYIQATTNNGLTPMVDSFQTTANHTVYSTVCCSSNTIVPTS
jgi:hypothetical protein